MPAAVMVVRAGEVPQPRQVAPLRTEQADVAADGPPDHAMVGHFGAEPAKLFHSALPYPRGPF